MGRDRDKEVGVAAYHIDKFCTGGDENDWKAAEAIVAELVDPVVAERDRLRGALTLANDVMRAAITWHPDGEIRRHLGEAMEAAVAALSTPAGPSPETCPECGATTYEERTEPSSIDYCAEPSVPYPCCPDCGWQGLAVDAPSPREEAVEAVVDWLRGDQAERVRADAIRDDVPPEDALAHVIEHKFLSAARPSSPTPEETKPRTISLRCPVCGMDTSDPKHQAWACEAMLT